MMVVIVTIQYRAANLKRCDAYAVEFFRIFEHMQFRNRLQGVVYVHVGTGDGGSMLVSIVGWLLVGMQLLDGSGYTAAQCMSKEDARS